MITFQMLLEYFVARGLIIIIDVNVLILIKNKTYNPIQMFFKYIIYIYVRIFHMLFFKRMFFKYTIDVNVF